MRQGTLLAAVLLALSFSSCTCSSTTPAVPKPTPVARAGWVTKPSPRSGEVRVPDAVQPEDIEAREAPTPPPATPEQAVLPDDFPSDVPVYEGADVAAVQKLANGASNIVFTVDHAEIPQVFDFYKNDMRGSGWNVEQEYQGKEQSFLSFKKGNTITNVSVTTDPKSGRKVIAVMYYDEQPLPFEEF